MGIKFNPFTVNFDFTGNATGSTPSEVVTIPTFIRKLTSYNGSRVSVLSGAGIRVRSYSGVVNNSIVGRMTSYSDGHVSVQGNGGISVEGS